MAQQPGVAAVQLRVTDVEVTLVAVSRAGGAGGAGEMGGIDGVTVLASLDTVSAPAVGVVTRPTPSTVTGRAAAATKAGHRRRNREPPYTGCSSLVRRWRRTRR